jgi:hypothetical protein
VASQGIDEFLSKIAACAFGEEARTLLAGKDRLNQLELSDVVFLENAAIHAKV